MSDPYHRLPDDEALLAISDDPEAGIIELIEILQKTYRGVGNTYSSADDLAIKEYLNAYLENFPGCIQDEIEVPSQGGGLVNFKAAILRSQRMFKARAHAKSIFARKLPDWQVRLADGHRSQLRDLINRLRQILEEIDIAHRHKENIVSKIDAFAAEVERDVSRIDKLGALWLAVTRYAGEGAKNLEPVVRLVETARKVFGCAQDDQDRNLLSAIDERKLIVGSKPGGGGNE